MIIFIAVVEENSELLKEVQHLQLFKNHVDSELLTLDEEIITKALEY